MDESLNNLLEEFGEPLFFIGGTPVTIASLLTFVGIIAVTYVASAILQRTLSRVSHRRDVDAGTQLALNRLLHYVIIALGLFLAIDNLGISLTALAAVGGVLLVGIGFGLQNIAQNFVSGLILLLERPVRKGDYIQVGDFEGTVVDIRARATIIRTHDDIEVIIPNGMLVTEVVTNRSLDSPYYRIWVEVGVADDSDTELVRETLLKVAKAHPHIQETPEPTVFFENFGESSLEFRLLGWLDDARLEPDVRSDLRFGVNKALIEAGVDMPFPQYDVHVRSGLEGLRGRG